MPAVPALELETVSLRPLASSTTLSPTTLSPSSVSPHGKILVNERHCLKKSRWTAPKQGYPRLLFGLNACPHVRMCTNTHSCTHTVNLKLGYVLKVI